MGISIKLNNTTIAEVDSVQSVEVLQQIVCEKLNVRPEEFYFTQNGRKVTPLNADELDLEASIQTIFRMLGGKGGFGSMLRAIGAQIEKTTNRDACRDLSGRRLRDINEEKRLKAWLEKQQDRESDQYAKKKQKLERLLAKPRHDFKDEDYEQARSELTANVGEAVEEGFKKAQSKEAAAAATAAQSTSGQKRKNGAEGGQPQKKKSHLWIAADLSSGSDDTTDSDDSDAEEPAVKEKKKVAKEEEDKGPAAAPHEKDESNSSVEK